MDSSVVLCDLALGIFFKMVIMRSISGAARLDAAPAGRAHVACAHTYAHTHIQTRGYQNKVLPDISDLKPKIYG